MKVRFAIITTALAAMGGSWITASAGGPGANAADSDLGRLQGRWTARAGARREVRVVLNVQGQKVDAAITTPQGIRLQVQGEMKLDETTSPRSLDWVNFSKRGPAGIPANTSDL